MKLTAQQLANAQRLKEQFLAAGLSPALTSASIGNMFAESGLNVKAYNPNDKGKPSEGLLQWRDDRQRNLHSFAADSEQYSDELTRQAAFFLHEFNPNGAERASYNALQGVEDPRQAGVALAQRMIRPAAEHIPVRGDYAEQMHQILFNGPDAGIQFAGGPSGQSSTDIAFDPVKQAFGQQDSRGQAPSEIMDMILRMGQLGQTVPAACPPMPNPLSEQVRPPQQDTSLWNAYMGDGPKIGNPLSEQARPPQQDTSLWNAYMGDGPQIGNPLSEQARPPQQDTSLWPAYMGDQFGASPNEGKASLDAEALIDENLPADGNRKASTVLNTGFAEMAEMSAGSLGVPVEDAPRSVNEVVAAAADKSPAATPEEEVKKGNRRLIAADMLQALSTGLGQIGAGQAVDLSAIFQRQAAVRSDMQVQQQAEAERQAAAQERQTAIANFQANGQQGLAALASTGEEGYKQAMQAAGSIAAQRAKDGGAAPPPTLKSLPFDQQVAYYQDMGASLQAAEAYALDPSLGGKFLENMVGTGDSPQPAEVATLLGNAIKYQDSHPAVKAAVERVLVNPNDKEAFSNLQSTMNGVSPKEGNSGPLDLSPEDIAAIREDAVKEGMSPALADIMVKNPDMLNEYVNGSNTALTKGIQKRFETEADVGVREAAATAANKEKAAVLQQAGVFTPTEALVYSSAGEEGVKMMQEDEKAKRSDSAAQSLAQSIAADVDDLEVKQMLLGVTTQEQLKSALDYANSTNKALPDMVRQFQYAENNPQFMQFLTQMKRLDTGNELVGPQKVLLDTQMAGFAARYAEIDGQRNLITSMRTINNLVTKIDPVTGKLAYDSGMVTGTLGAVSQRVLNDLFGDDAPELVDDYSLFTMRVMERDAGQFFGDFRAVGSGSSSDMESRMFLKAMAVASDSPLQAAGVTQQFMRYQQLASAEVEAEQRWYLDNANKPELLLDKTAMNKYIDDSVASMGVEIFPEVDFSDQKKLEADFKSGNITDSTVVMYIDPKTRQPTYGVFGEVTNKFLGGQP